MGARERVPVGRGNVFRAAEGGHLEVLQWARANGCPWSKWDCKVEASTNECWETLEWIERMSDDSDDDDT